MFQEFWSGGWPRKWQRQRWSSPIVIVLQGEVRRKEHRLLFLSGSRTRRFVVKGGTRLPSLSANQDKFQEGG